MKIYNIIIGLSVFAFVACTNAKAKEKPVTHKKEVKLSSGLEKIPLFADCDVYSNNLSKLALEVDFVALDMSLPISPFQVLDIALTDEYVFLMGMYKISQYDRNGKFIRSVGSKGRGPKEYIQLEPPIQLDRKVNKIYVNDCRGNKIQVYDFDGKHSAKIRVKSNVGGIHLIDSSLIVSRQNLDDRLAANTPLITFINNKGKELKVYPSHLYPRVKEKHGHNGSTYSSLWEYASSSKYLEYGADTIFRIEKTKLIPESVLTGEMKPSLKEYFRRDVKDKLLTCQGILRPNCGVFESDNLLIFKVYQAKLSYYKIYNKIEKIFSRTFYPDAPVSKRGNCKMDFFIDDIVSGLTFKAAYQSDGKVISIVAAEDIVEKRDEILDFISNHPSKSSAKLKGLIQNIKEEDNPLIMSVKFK